MKLKLDAESVFFLEDVLLDVYTGLNLSHLEGDLFVAEIVNAIQAKIYKDEDFE